MSTTCDWYARCAEAQVADHLKVITSVTSTRSVAYHRRLGSHVEPADDYDGPDAPKMAMTRPLSLRSMELSG